MRFTLVTLLLLLPAIVFTRPKIPIPADVSEVEHIAMAKRAVDPVTPPTMEPTPPVEDEEPFERTTLNGRPYKMFVSRTPKHGIMVRRFVPDHVEPIA